MIPGVMTVQPQQLGTSQQEHFSGIVKEQQDMNLGFKTPGQILKIYVKEGQYIQKGQLLAQLDDKDYNLGVKAAQVQATQLEHEVERLQKLYKAKSISGNDYEKAISGLEQVRINLKSNQNKVEYTRLYAPTSGIVETVNFEEMEKALIIKAMERADWVIGKAAPILGLSYKTLQYRLEKHGIEKPEKRGR